VRVLKVLSGMACIYKLWDGSTILPYINDRERVGGGVT